jgi:hypothetical protein
MQIEQDYRRIKDLDCFILYGNEIIYTLPANLF